MSLFKGMSDKPDRRKWDNILFQILSSWWGSYPSVEKLSVYSTAPADWAISSSSWLPFNLFIFLPKTKKKMVLYLLKILLK